MTATSIHHEDGSLNLELIEGLTLTGDSLSAQVRQYADGLRLALFTNRPAAVLSSEEPGGVTEHTEEDARQLRDLLNLATARGVL